MPSTPIASRPFGYLFACGIAMLTGLSGLSACNDDDAADHGHGPDDHNAEVGPMTGATCPDGSTLTYDSFGKKFMQDYCLGCHSSSVKGAARNGAPDDHNFDSLAEISLLKNHIDELAGSGPEATNDIMPPAQVTKKPTLEERKKLSEWLACGPK